MTWKQEAAQIILVATKGLPEETTLSARKRIVDAACPWEWKSTSWPMKAWQAARRDYLIRYGYQPRTKKALTAVAKGLPLFDRGAG